MKRTSLSTLVAAAAALAAGAFLVACGAGSSARAPASGGDTGAPPQPGLVAFETVRSVLQHARCQNCHPRGDAPLQGDDGHAHLQNVQRGPDGRGMVGERCTTCHGPLNPPDSYGAHTPPGIATGWRMPKPEERLVFVGIAPGALCEQIKDPARNGGKDMAALRVHLDDPLVTWAWTPGFGRSPPPVSRQAFLDAWTTWANAGAPCPK
jgi:cytochrome c5